MRLVEQIDRFDPECLNDNQWLEISTNRGTVKLRLRDCTPQEQDEQKETEEEVLNGQFLTPVCMSLTRAGIGAVPVFICSNKIAVGDRVKVYGATGALAENWCFTILPDEKEETTNER